MAIFALQALKNLHASHNGANEMFFLLMNLKDQQK